jgi:hypothetical protein
MLRPKDARRLDSLNLVPRYSNPLSDGHFLLATPYTSESAGRSLKLLNLVGIGALPTHNASGSVLVLDECRDKAFAPKTCFVFALADNQAFCGQIPSSHAMHRKRKLLLKPFQPSVYACGFSLRVGKDRRIWHWRYFPVLRHQCQGAALDSGSKREKIKSS